MDSVRLGTDESERLLSVEELAVQLRDFLLERRSKITERVGMPVCYNPQNRFPGARIDMPLLMAIRWGLNMALEVLSAENSELEFRDWVYAGSTYEVQPGYFRIYLFVWSVRKP